MHVESYPERLWDAEFEDWWLEEQGSSMAGSKYLGRKAWRAALKLYIAEQRKFMERLTEHSIAKRRVDEDESTS